jgi:glutathione S-transferase
LQELDIPPSQNLPDGTPRYTVPAIHDSSTGAKVSDSYDIIKYLDQTYPDTPQIIVDSQDEFLQSALRRDWGLVRDLMLPTGLVLGHIALSSMEGESRLKYQRSYEKAFKATNGQHASEAEPSNTHWKQAEESYGRADAWLTRAEQLSGGPWALGASPTWPDIVLVSSSIALFITAVGEEGEEWQNVLQWNEGRWLRLWSRIKPYSRVY